jgi:GR25 family glycosyltransferase involved in LPS biosynthesis
MFAQVYALDIPAEKRHRFSAITHSCSWIGCTKSHYEVLQLAKKEGWSRVWILEDDWMATISSSDIRGALDSVLGVEGPAWDVLFLSSHVQASEAIHDWPLELPQIRRGYNIQTASSYIVASSFYDRLIENLREAVTGALAGGQHWDYINDQYWKRLQADRTTRWLYFSPALGKQRAGHSDLAGHFTDYGV